MEKNPTTKKISFVKLFGFFVLTTCLIITSELIYQVKHNSRELTYLLLKNTTVVSNKTVVGKYFNEFLAQSLYNYLSKSDGVLHPEIHPCQSVCLSYEEEQTTLKLFKKLVARDALVSLDKDQKPELYFWMASFNIWHNDDQTTTEWLEYGLKGSDNEKIKEFYDDLKSLKNIYEDPAIQEYFDGKLESVDKTAPRYKQVYFAKAAYDLATISLASDDLDKAKKYLNKAISLNRWSLDYYISLSEIYVKENEIEKAKKTLKECISNISGDPLVCEKKLNILILGR